MSAAEKLKALHERIAPSDTDHWPLDEDSTVGLAGGNLVAVSSLRHALPQIVAVVEAAERFKDSTVPPERRKKYPQLFDLYAALSALDEALGDVT